MSPHMRFAMFLLPLAGLVTASLQTASAQERMRRGDPGYRAGQYEWQDAAGPRRERQTQKPRRHRRYAPDGGDGGGAGPSYGGRGYGYSREPYWGPPDDLSVSEMRPFFNGCPPRCRP